MDFCPFDFKKIGEDKENLAYELVFPENWTWDAIKKETVVGEQKRTFISENDRRRDKHFREDRTVEHVMLLERKKATGKSGFTLLKELIAFHNANREEKAGSSGLSVPAVSLKEEYGIESDFDADYGFDEAGPIALYHKVDNGIDTFVDEDGDDVMYAMPCCPYCHNRLPIGWQTAEDFAAVSLMGPTGGGKTSFLYSMMNKNWAPFRNLGYINGRKLSIASAHRVNDPTDTMYYRMSQASEDMCRDYGNCPDSTFRQGWIPPVFLNVQYAGHTMIVGIYDNAGENLLKMNPDKPYLTMLRDKMFADIYLFDPADLRITLPKEKDQMIHAGIGACQMWEIEAQGEYQASHAGQTVSARDLLREAFRKPDAGSEGGGRGPLDVYDMTYSVRQQYNCLPHMKTMYFLGVIIKCDLIEDAPEVRKSGEYDVLFDRRTQGDMVDIGQMTARSDLVREMIDKLKLLGEKKLVDFQRDYGELDEDEKETGRNAVSWHCVSALGCDAEKGEKLLGEYAPIRVAEPLVTCIVKRIADNGWISAE